MHFRTKFIFSLIVGVLLTTSGARVNRSVTAQATKTQRLQFRVATIEERSSERKIISEATIEGPAGTDFDINLQGERFKMNARFLTDLIAPGTLKVRANLDTRRLYGYSERELPLYEEDRQQQTIEMGFEEQIVLLPFGRQDAGEKIKIEITPSLSQKSVYLTTGKLRPLEIDILKQAPNGEVSIQASRSPHNFEVEASLWEDGVEVARGVADAFIEEAREIRLQPTARAGATTVNNPLLVMLTVDEYRRSRPADYVSVHFDAHRLENSEPSARRPVAQRWAGIGAIGSNLTYDVSDYYRKDAGKRYELRLHIKLAKGELTD